MSQPALQLVGADLEQAERAAADVSTSPEVEEARRMAELAGAFALCGLNIALSSEALWTESADQPYRAEPETTPAANDAQAPAPRLAFPELNRRGVHLDPALPMRLIKAIDWLFVFVAAEVAALWGAGLGLAHLSIGGAAAFIASALSLKAGLWLTESYRFTPARMRAERGLGGLALGAIIGLVIAAVFAPDARAAAALSVTLPIAAMLLAGVHAALAVWTRAAHRAGVFAETVVIVGANEAAERLAARATKSGEARVIAIADDRLARAPAQLGDVQVGGGLEDLLAWEGLPHVDRIVIAVTAKAETRVKEIVQRLRIIPNRVDLLLDYQTFNVRGRGADRIGGAALACVSGRPHSHRRAMVKRAQDVVLGALALTVFALPMLLIALAVTLDSKGPVIYRQRRHGFNNRVITMLKFRSMHHDPDAPLEQVRPNDPRVTRVGRFLRRTSLDELPQLFNVLRGEMSLVGPRPHAIGIKTAERELAHIVAEYAHRHRVKPGITGWAQVNGSRGAMENCAAVRRRVRLDLEYVARASLWFDLQILMRTIPALFGDAKATR